MTAIKTKLVQMLRWSEAYTKTDMVYFMRGSFWMNANMAITTLLSFVLSIAFANFISKESYGAYQFALSIASILTAFTLTGMNTAIARSVSMGFEGSFIPSIKVQLRYNLFPLALALCAAAYYLLNGNLALALSLLIIGIAIPIQNSFNTYPAFMMGKKDFRKVFWFAQAQSIPYTAVMIASLYLTDNPVLLILVNLGWNSIINVILHFAAVRLYKPNDNIDPGTISFGKHLSWIGILSTIAAQLDNIIVYHYIGAAELAIYAFATTLPEKANTVGKMIGNIALPKLSNRTAGEIQKVILVKSLKTGALSFAISLIYIALAPFIFKIFFPNYTGSIVFSQAYAVMLAISALSALPLTALTALEARREILLFNIINPIISIAVMLGAAYMYGVWGLIAAKGISGIFIFTAALFLIHRVKSPNQDPQAI